MLTLTANNRRPARMENIPDLHEEEHTNSNRKPEAQCDQPAHDGPNFTRIPTLLETEECDNNADDADHECDQSDLVTFGICCIRTHSIIVLALCVVRQTSLRRSRFVKVVEREHKERLPKPLPVKCDLSKEASVPCRS